MSRMTLEDSRIVQQTRTINWPFRLIAEFKLGPSYQASQHRISVSENKRVRRDAMHFACSAVQPVRVGVLIKKYWGLGACTLEVNGVSTNPLLAFYRQCRTFDTFEPLALLSNPIVACAPALTAPALAVEGAD